jgi:hypothetical protein
MSEWTKFQGDFDAMTNAEIEAVTREEQAKVDDAEEWLEAVAAWEAAGRPRTKKAALKLAKGEDRNG